MEKRVYLFGKGITEGNKEMRELLGGKGANLAEMASIGLPVPPGFTITTENCLGYLKLGRINNELKDEVKRALIQLEMETGKELGSTTSPLLLSIRSGARTSMPGMMDTILNLGLNDQTVLSLAKNSDAAKFAWDSYRRFIQMFSNVVKSIDHSLFDQVITTVKAIRKITKDSDLKEDELKKIVSQYKEIYLSQTGEAFPQDVEEQLWSAVEAVFLSWNNTRAIKYRDLNGIPHDWGTAVNIQSMVFGNLGKRSGTGVCFTRNPSTGENSFFGEYLVNAQGEDVVAGIRTPAPINDSSKNLTNINERTMEEYFPETFKQLVEMRSILENHYCDMQDIEFTIEDDKLFLLQTRNGKRSVEAAIKIAVDMANEGLITEKEALKRIEPEDLNHLLHPCLDTTGKVTPITKGLPASPGAASGVIALTSKKAIQFKEMGISSLLVREETCPEDIDGMVAATGILTARGGMTSHAAVVARGMGVPCVSACENISFNQDKKSITIGGLEFKEGAKLTIDGKSGEVYLGEIPTKTPEFTKEYYTFMEWADKYKSLKIRTNADTPKDTLAARNFGAEGIGLCRTEHMFFEKSRLLAMREMIFSKTSEERKNALSKIIPFQRNDFIEIFKVMNGHPVNIRLLDPPLHEFLPHTKVELDELAKNIGISSADIKTRKRELVESNPMLGHRGCRIGITYPEIYKMQVRAITEAAIVCKNEGVEVSPEIMIPLIAMESELRSIRQQVEEEIKAVFEESDSSIEYKIGTMIELPRAAITAGEIARSADFFSFGTNDLTQTTFGLSRDDAGKFLPHYVSSALIKRDPFIGLDQSGVGHLVQHASLEGKKTNNKIHLGICGEHGGDPQSIEFCQRVGLDYVSCSPFRVPIARLAAAQAALK